MKRAHSDTYSEDLNHDSNARDDYFEWIKEDNNNRDISSKSKIIRIFEDIRNIFSKYISFSTIEHINEIQLAIYPPNSTIGYVKHRDSYPLSIFDLNKDSPRR